MNQKNALLSRMFTVFGLVLLIPCAIGMQLVRINFLKGDELRNLWSEQAIDSIPISAQRGNIYDADGSLLVTNSVGYKVAIDPHINGIQQDDINRVCETLAKFSSHSSSYYQRKIRSAPARSRYVVLGKNVPAPAYEALQSLNLHALILEEHYQRRHGFGDLAAHTLGYVNFNMDGQAGLEKQYNSLLKGTDGVQQVRRDRAGRIFAYLGAPKKLPQQGYSLHTTIDGHIQAILEEELQAGVARTKSSYGTAIVLDPKTGAVKALANYPTFDPNNPGTLGRDNHRNFMISDMIEPGSTFKLITAVAAVEQNKVRLDEPIETPDSGKLKIHGQWMRDHDPLGTLSFEEVIEKSSNVGTSKVAMRLNDDTFYQYARNLGFGTPTNVDLPAEEDGVLRKPFEWSKVSLPWMSIGYEVQVTPLQVAQAYAAFANGGRMMRPYVVSKVVDGQGQTIKENNPLFVRRIAKKQTIEKLYPAFKRVVSDSGTADQAQVPGLAIAGKTGTAQKLINGRYQREYRGTFVGFFPADDPKYLCLVMLDEPQTWPPYGGWVAGPIFQHTANRIAGLDNDIERKIIAHERPDTLWAHAPALEGLPKEKATALLKNQGIDFNLSGTGPRVHQQSPQAGEPMAQNQKVTLTLTSQQPQDSTQAAVAVPGVLALSMRNAVQIMHQAGFKTKIIGNGSVQKQYPTANSTMQKGKTVVLRGSTTIALNN